MGNAYKIKKQVFEKILGKLVNQYDVIAPVTGKKAISFEKISSEQIPNLHLGALAYLPAKYLFFRHNQELFGFKDNRIDINDDRKRTRERILLGLKRCDLNSIQRQDIMFLKETNDYWYKKEREKTILVGNHCREQYDEHCFCASMDLTNFFDVMLYDKDSFLIVETGSEKGERLIKKYKRYFTKTNYKLSAADKKTKTRTLNKKDLTKYYDYKEWEQLAQNCLSCAACTVLCPGCYCFNLDDTVRLSNTKEGVRMRTHASCQLKSFTRVAGDSVFREQRTARLKHRVYHHLQYFRERHGINLCTGCGRCIRHCPTRIDFVKMLNEIK